MKRFVWMLYFFASVHAASVHAASSGCIQNCGVHTPIITFGTATGCPTCNATTFANALSQAAANGCLCAETQLFITSAWSLTRTLGAITSFDTGGPTSAVLISCTSAIIPLTISNASNITATCEISHIHFKKVAAGGDSANIATISGGTVVSGAGYNFNNDWIESGSNGSTSSNFSISGSTWNVGARLLFNKVINNHSTTAISATNGLWNLTGTLGDDSIVTIQNSISDAGGTTITSASAMTKMASGPTVNPQYLYYDDLFIGLSSAAHVFNGTANFSHSNCAFYNPNSTGYEYDTASAGSIVVNSRVTASYSAYSNLTAYAGTGNIFGLTSAAFRDYPNADYRLSFGSALFEKGTNNGVTDDITGKSRPQRSYFDIGPYELPSGLVKVPLANYSRVPQ